MNRKKKYDNRAKFEIRQERIAVMIMIICVLPILYIYGKFFSNAFIDQQTGSWTLSNFNFFKDTIKIGNSIIEPIGPSMKNTIFFTAIVTLCEVVFSCMAGYALSRLDFWGKKTLTLSLLILRMFPGVLLLIGVVYVLMYIGIVNTMLV
mgnify:FL=1